MNKSLSFTLRHDGKVRTLVTDFLIANFYDPKSPPPHPKFEKFSAIWDTGATNSVINQNIIDKCNMIPTGMTKVSHVLGTVEDVPTFLVNIGLPNQVAFSGIRVTRGAVTGGDALIGMDIITKGDFVVTNHMGKTVFSFRCPSSECIDFLDGPVARPNILPSFPARNDHCHCGSGRKYKKCCLTKDLISQQN